MESAGSSLDPGARHLVQKAPVSNFAKTSPYDMGFHPVGKASKNTEESYVYGANRKYQSIKLKKACCVLEALSGSESNVSQEHDGRSSSRMGWE